MTCNPVIIASYTQFTIRVYQAYNHTIADSILAIGRPTPPTFKMSRMTWIKPSFLWMMHRSGWATKHNQERILAFDITRVGFEWALSSSCISHIPNQDGPSISQWRDKLAASPVRVQWDPDRSLEGAKLPRRAIQVGLSGPAVLRFCNEWITDVGDITELSQSIMHLLANGKLSEARERLPRESEYPLEFDQYGCPLLSDAVIPHKPS